MRCLRVRARLACIWVLCASCATIYFVKWMQTQVFYDALSLNGAKNLDSALPSVHIVRKDRQSSNTQDNSTSDLAAQGCSMPELKIDDPELRKYFFGQPPLNCSKDPNWVYVGNGTFNIDPRAVEVHGKIKCKVLYFWRISDQKTYKDAIREVENGSALISDFFKVRCRSADKESYRNVQNGISYSADAVRRAAGIRGNATREGDPPMNVYMLGFDSISRMTFLRKMPKTHKYLTEKMGAIVLKKYNIVGDGTPQALIPILTGKTETELPLTRKRFKEANYVNVYPFVWNDYRDAGYITLYGEDAAAIGTFTYRLKGFNEQPTDHYMRTFYTVAEEMYKHHAPNCLGSDPHHVMHFRYAEKFFDAYPNYPKFAFMFHSVLSHDNLNNIELADDDMVRHLEFFEKNGYLNNTAIFFMADHGHRFANIRSTQQGKLEERLPFFAVAMPPWFEKKFPQAAKNLQMNADRLTTPFDIYSTFRTILNFPEQPKVGSLKERSISLFDEVPKERGCVEATIEPHWCACLAWQDLAVSDTLVIHMAKSVVAAINKETEKERSLCAPLKLHQITKALKYAPNEKVMQYKKARDYDGFVPEFSTDVTVNVEYYQLSLVTEPGAAHYEASVRYDKTAKLIHVDLDQISHINQFGDLPHCIIDKDYFLIKWCVCYDRVGNTHSLLAGVNTGFSKFLKMLVASVY